MTYLTLQETAMAIWLNRSGKHSEHEKKFLDEGRIYLTWEVLDQDLSQLSDRKALMSLLENIYPNSKKHRRIQYSGQIWAFVKRMAIGDWVCIPSKRKTIHIGEITSNYVYDPNAQEIYRHYRTVKWLETDIPRTNFDQDILHTLGAFTTICQIKRHDAETRIRAMRDHGWKSTGIILKPLNDDEGTTDEDISEELDLEQVARDQIAKLIYSKFSGHGMENLVEAILQAQGFTTHSTGKGADGGIDILAAPDTLGFGQPSICVQVKSQDSPLER
ncbi:MAG: restriction endonuclease, partial [Gammaproteobacteria bacterium]